LINRKTKRDREVKNRTQVKAAAPRREEKVKDKKKKEE
jgi:hypothetical protein